MKDNGRIQRKKDYFYKIWETLNLGQYKQTHRNSDLLAKKKNCNCLRFPYDRGSEEQGGNYNEFIAALPKNVSRMISGLF